MNGLLRPRTWVSFRASSGVGPFDVLFKYASGPTPCGCPVARPSRLSARDGGRRIHLHGLETPIREICELDRSIHKLPSVCESDFANQ
jgi:hypothetical protein